MCIYRARKDEVAHGVGVGCRFSTYRVGAEETSPQRVRIQGCNRRVMDSIQAFGIPSSYGRRTESGGRIPAAGRLTFARCLGVSTRKSH